MWFVKASRFIINVPLRSQRPMLLNRLHHYKRAANALIVGFVLLTNQKPDYTTYMYLYCLLNMLYTICLIKASCLYTPTDTNTLNVSLFVYVYLLDFACLRIVTFVYKIKHTWHKYLSSFLTNFASV